MDVVPGLVAGTRRSRPSPEDVRLKAEADRLPRSFADRLSDRLVSSRYSRGNLHAYDSRFSLVFVYLLMSHEHSLYLVISRVKRKTEVTGKNLSRLNRALSRVYNGESFAKTEGRVRRVLCDKRLVFVGVPRSWLVSAPRRLGAAVEASRRHSGVQPCLA